MYRAVTFADDGSYVAILASCRYDCRELGTYKFGEGTVVLNAAAGRARRLKLRAEAPRASTAAIGSRTVAPRDTLLVDGTPLSVPGATLLGFDAESLRPEGASAAPAVDVGTFVGLAGKSFCDSDATAAADCSSEGKEAFHCDANHRCVVGVVNAVVSADRKSTRLNSSHVLRSRMPSSA